MDSTTHPSLGRAASNLRGDIIAGSWQSCSLTYTAGPAGIDDTGSIKISMRFPTDCGTPQFDDPQAANYTTARASNGAHLQLRYDVKDNVRPWGRTLHVKVLQGYLKKNDQITIVLGDQSHGSPGWRIQTFLEKSFELRFHVDRYATYCYERLPKSPSFRIVAGPPTKLVAVAPSQVCPGKKITVRLKREDRWGNPTGRPWKESQPAIVEEGVQRIAIIDAETSLRTETNPICVQHHPTWNRYWADLHGQSEETVGTNSVDDYFRFGRDLGFLDACAHQGNDFQITDDFWQTIQATTAKYHQAGRFVTFPGWEWSGNTGLGGDRNVLYRKEGLGVISRSCRALVTAEQSVEPCSQNVNELFKRLAPFLPDVMLIPHVGGRYADLNYHDSRLEPVVEVHSAWGTFEWMLADAFEHGYRIGIVANSDGHKGRPGASYPGASTFGSYGGLTAILADTLDRDSLWQAYRERRVYGTTGARIHLDVTCNGRPMGSVITKTKGQEPRLQVHVHGTAPIERVEVRNAMKVLTTRRPYQRTDLANRVKILWQGSEVRGRGRQTNWDGSLRITGNQITRLQTVNFLNPEKECQRQGPRHVNWESTTTGGAAGLILSLANGRRGQLVIETTQKRAKLSLANLGIRGRTYQTGGLDKQLSVYPLPRAGGEKDLAFETRITPAALKQGDNPLYICVVQEDGQMAWSSPIYWVR